MSMSKVYDTTIRELRKDFARTPLGDIGIEIEAEGPHGGANPASKWQHNRIQANRNPKYWITKEDHSLRNGVEYVTTTAVPLSELDACLAEFAEFSKDTKYRTESIRTSVHYHINVGDLTLNQVLAAIVGYWLLETPLVGTQPAYRIGNLHCLRVSDADFLVNDLCSALEKEAVPLVEGFLGDNVKYAALNLNTVYRFGSLEFRFNAGSTDIKEIGEWARFFHTMVHRFAKLGDPAGVVRFVEQKGALDLLDYIAPIWLQRTIRANTGWVHEIESNYSYAYMVHNKIEELKRRNATKTETIFNRRHLFSVDPDGDDNGAEYILPDCVDFSPDEEGLPRMEFIKGWSNKRKPRWGTTTTMAITAGDHPIPQPAPLGEIHQATPINWNQVWAQPATLAQGDAPNWHAMDNPDEEDFPPLPDFETEELA